MHVDWTTLKPALIRMNCTALLIGMLLSDAHAQQEVGFRVGRARIAPTVGVSNAGVDTNIFNDPSDPRQDVTANFSGNVLFDIPLGRTRLNGRTGTGYYYFREFASQRSFNTDSSVQWTAPINRFSPNVSVQFARMRARPNLEIDARVEHRLSNISVGTGIRVSPRSSLGIEVNRSRFLFGDDAVFLGAPLRSTLDRSSEGVSLSFSHRLTALTRMGVTTTVARDTFDNMPDRSAKRYSIRPTVQFAPTALIRGSAEVGWGRFDIGGAGIPDYNGFMAAVDLSSAIRGNTQVNVRVGRDVNASFTDAEPYYVQTGIGVGVTQRVTDVLSLNMGVRRERLDYRADRSVLPVTGSVLRVDNNSSQYSMHGGAWYKLGPMIGFGLSVEYLRRDGGVRGDYRGLRASSAVSYGF